MKATAKEKKIIEGMRVGDKNEIVRNRFSGVSVELCPEAVALYDVILGCEASLYAGYNEKTETLFYTARDIFRKNWPNEFMLLID